MKLPSKELMEAVLEVNIKYISNEHDGYLIPYEVALKDGSEWRNINKYEFMYRCKEWAYNQSIGKTGTYNNGCGKSAQHKMSDINIITKRYNSYLYISQIDNNRDLNCSLEYYGLVGRDNHPDKRFNVEANTVKDIAFYADTETEAIFKACNYILENLK